MAPRELVGKRIISVRVPFTLWGWLPLPEDARVLIGFEGGEGCTGLLVYVGCIEFEIAVLIGESFPEELRLEKWGPPSTEASVK